MVLWLYNWLTIYFPQRLRPRLNKIFGPLDKIFDTIIEEHEQQTPSKQGRHRDFVDMLLSLMNQPMNISDEQETTLDQVKIKAIPLDMFTGASDWWEINTTTVKTQVRNKPSFGNTFPTRMNL